ncbi:L-dopachrome tautomerase-related protein [Eleftheria terrae]|uniref:L-dopachrome tautomerase-related protein n=1 Tax=Eleftheria terrae TaxID=1597781 RepID=UPI003436B55D
MSLLSLSFAAAMAPAGATEPAAMERWRSYAGVTWEAPAEGNTADADSVNAPIAGLHFDRAGRAFVSTPRLISARSPATLSVLHTGHESGPARLRAFPSAEGNSVAAAPEQHLRNVLGFHVDARNGWLWALDMGFVAGEPEAPVGAQKIVVYDLKSGRTVKRIGLDAVADRKGSFLNDLAVDERRKLAYISDSGLRSAPRNQAAIIVVDLESGRARRVLDRHVSVMPEAGVKVTAHGEAVWPGHPLTLGINGIALSPSGDTLYWTVTTSTKAYSLPAALLRSSASDAQLAAAVTLLGDVGGNTDGIVAAADGRLYITDVSHNGIVRFDPQTRRMELLGANEDVYWPDTATLTPDGDLVFTASRLNAHFAGAVKPGAERYDLWRLKLPR